MDATTVYQIQVAQCAVTFVILFVTVRDCTTALLQDTLEQSLLVLVPPASSIKRKWLVMKSTDISS